MSQTDVENKDSFSTSSMTSCASVSTLFSDYYIQHSDDEDSFDSTNRSSSSYHQRLLSHLQSFGLNVQGSMRHRYQQMYGIIGICFCVVLIFIFSLLLILLYGSHNLRRI